MQAQTITLPHWLTPAFARTWLKQLDAASPGRKRDQIERYRAIARGADWNEHRGYALAWREPYTGHVLADQAKATVKLVTGDDDLNAGNGPGVRLTFWQIAKRAIDDGALRPETVNELAEQGQRDGWGSALQKLREEIK